MAPLTIFPALIAWLLAISDTRKTQSEQSHPRMGQPCSLYV